MLQPPAFNAGGWASFQRKTCARARACGTCGDSGPPLSGELHRTLTRSGWYTWRSGTRLRGSGLTVADPEHFHLWDTWRHRTHPRAGSGSGTVGPVRRIRSLGPVCSAPKSVATDNHACLSLDTVEVGTPAVEYLTVSKNYIHYFMGRVEY